MLGIGGEPQSEGRERRARGNRWGRRIGRLESSRRPRRRRRVERRVDVARGGIDDAGGGDGRLDLGGRTRTRRPPWSARRRGRASRRGARRGVRSGRGHARSVVVRRRSTPSRRLWGTHPASSDAREGKGLVSVAERAGGKGGEGAERGGPARTPARGTSPAPRSERRTTIWAGAAWRGVRSGRGARARATAHLEYERQSAGAFASLKRDGDADAVGIHLEATKDPVGRAGRLDARVHRRHVRPQHLRRRRGVRAHARELARGFESATRLRGDETRRARVFESRLARCALCRARTPRTTQLCRSRSIGFTVWSMFNKGNLLLS